MRFYSEWDSSLTFSEEEGVLTLVSSAAGCILLLETSGPKNNISDGMNIYSLHDGRFHPIAKDAELNEIICNSDQNYIIKSWHLKLSSNIHIKNIDHPTLSLKEIREKDCLNCYFKSIKLPALLSIFNINFSLIESEGVGANSFDKNIALLNASKIGDIALAKKCIELEADINTMANVSESIFSFFQISRWTPLMYAAYYGHLDMVRLLTENGASVDKTNFAGENATRLAWKAGKMEVYIYLYFMKNIVNCRYKDTSYSGLLPFKFSNIHEEVYERYLNVIQSIDKGLLLFINNLLGGDRGIDLGSFREREEEIKKVLINYKEIFCLTFCIFVKKNLYPLAQQGSALWISDNFNAILQRYFFFKYLAEKYLPLGISSSHVNSFYNLVMQPAIEGKNKITQYPEVVGQLKKAIACLTAINFITTGTIAGSYPLIALSEAAFITALAVEKMDHSNLNTNSPFSKTNQNVENLANNELERLLNDFENAYQVINPFIEVNKPSIHSIKNTPI